MERIAKHFVVFIISLLFISFAPIKEDKYDEPEGYAIIVSVPRVNNKVLKEKYKIPEGHSFADLPGASYDGEKIKNILTQQGFKGANIIHLGANATDTVTEESIVTAFNKIAGKVKDNDLFVFYYSGHGNSYKDQLGGDEADGKDEVFVTWKTYLLDDKINAIYTKNFTNTRNVMIVDACRGGSMYEIFKREQLVFVDDIKNTDKPVSITVSCQIAATTKENVGFDMLYYGASRDENDGYDTGDGGYFTSAFRSVYNPRYWKTIKPQDLACRISTQMKAINDPGDGNIQYTECGKPKEDFKNSYLFKIK